MERLEADVCVVGAGFAGLVDSYHDLLACVETKVQRTVLA
jgi:cation diffusion facilitator CzcD-associated flavoprotein CzcO